MEVLKNHKTERYIKYLLIILVVVFIALAVFFVIRFRSLHRQQIMHIWESHISQILQRRAPLPTSDTGVIRSWMTFDYINKLFNLPTDYLKTKLNVSDPNYPQITVYGYAKKEKIDQTTFIDKVINAVGEYVPSEISTSTKNL